MALGTGSNYSNTITKYNQLRKENIMRFLQGFRTIIFNVITAAASWIGVTYGIEISEEHQMAFCTTIIAVGNIALRLITTTPIGKKESKNAK